jgi:hypothetical protein
MKIFLVLSTNLTDTSTPIIGKKGGSLRRWAHTAYDWLPDSNVHYSDHPNTGHVRFLNVYLSETIFVRFRNGYGCHLVKNIKNRPVFGPQYTWKMVDHSKTNHLT